MGDVVEICSPSKIYSWQEAMDMIPMLKRISSETDVSIRKSLSEQSFVIKCGAPKHVLDKYDNLVQEELKRWGGKLARLGIQRLSGRLLFNTGFGFWVLDLNDTKIDHYVDYDKPISEMRKITIVER